jgi:hypothetical protein
MVFNMKDGHENMAWNMVLTYLHFRILKSPLNLAIDPYRWVQWILLKWLPFPLG